MKFRSWFITRGINFICHRSFRIFRRYGILPNRGMNRIRNCVELLNKFGCHPTFPTPGVIIQRYPKFITQITKSGAEIAVHGYQHLDLNGYSAKDASDQLQKATKIFNQNHIEFHGFRCPYLGFNEALLEVIPKGLFEYSSNSTINWNVNIENENHLDNPIFKTLQLFYHAKPSKDYLAIPWMRSNFLEIPICIPDDIQLLDGLGLTAKEIGKFWIQILRTTHRRGELFTLIFHPELASLLDAAFIDLLTEAKSYSPQVWIARLDEISRWWIEKSSFNIDLLPTQEGHEIRFNCSSRATILVKGIQNIGETDDWDGIYQRFTGNSITLLGESYPFIGLSRNFPTEKAFFLKEQGYILDLTERAPECSLFLDEQKFNSFKNEVELIDFIEENTKSLIRFWRWPEGARNALSVTGDLDALSLMDYLSRLYIA